MVTLGQLVKFVLDNRRGNAFKGYSEEVIASGIKRAADDGTLRYCCDEDGSIVGVVTGYVDPEKRIYHVHDIVTNKDWALPALVKAFCDGWPGFEMTACRKGKLVYYNTKKLCTKLMKGHVYGW